MSLIQAESVGASHVDERSPIVSVVIVNWNTEVLLHQCLSSLRQFIDGASLEIIVVDNASADGSVAMMTRLFPEVHVIANQDNLGFATGCNQGIEASKGRYVLLLNSDAYLIEDAIFPLLTEIEAAEDIGMISGQLLNEDLSIQGTCGVFPTLRNSIISRIRVSRPIGPHQPLRYPFCSLEDHESSRDVDWIAGAFMLVRRTAIDRVGLLDASIFLFAEEWDWCIRFQRAGFRIRYSPVVRIVHVGSGSWTMDSALLNQARRAGIYHFCRKHFGRMRAAIFLLATALGCALRLMVAGAKWVLLPNRRDLSASTMRSSWRGLIWAVTPKERWRIRSSDLHVVNTPLVGAKPSALEDSG